MTTAYALEVTDLQFSWQKSSPETLNITYLSLLQGESLFIQGPSGCGKSTLLNLLSGVISPQFGKISMLDQPLSTLNQTQRDQFRADHLGYIFQQFNLLPYLSVIDNVLLPMKLSATRRGDKSKHSTTLIDEAKHWLTQLRVSEHQFSEKVSKLSIGQQQRVAAARAIIGTPEIIIADEPTSALDHDNVENFMQVLTDKCKEINSSLIFVSHDHGLSRFFDQTYALGQNHRGI